MAHVPRKYAVAQLRISVIMRFVFQKGEKRGKAQEPNLPLHLDVYQ